MTKKDYEAIARAVRQVKPYEAQNVKDAVDKVILAISDTFERDNQRFDRKRFLEAIGFYESE